MKRSGDLFSGWDAHPVWLDDLGNIVVIRGHSRQSGGEGLGRDIMERNRRVSATVMGKRGYSQRSGGWGLSLIHI